MCTAVSQKGNELAEGHANEAEHYSGFAEENINLMQSYSVRLKLSAVNIQHKPHTNYTHECH